ncbi:hypothetical protein [Jiangella alba]|uniref:G domain-containing protein n=1 Tax=Jiangella alba TaxID=561176 RepID=A0A1H5PTH4_9ACTN|nr:hypothetical protein [Jiangella alba]SEF16498.1 hypothetical protein SAMN04488561_5404 [Jiangella alba]
MSDLWDGIHARWESIRHAVDHGDDGHRPPAAVARAGTLGVATNPIVICGPPGAGKTVLYGALAQLIRSGDPDSRRSPRIEKHTAQFGSGRRRTRAVVTVIPGQDSLERDEAMDDTMRGDASPHGLVYVACWGHNRIWQRTDQREVAARLTTGTRHVDPDEVRAWHLDKELLDFRTLVRDLIDQQVATRLRWLIVVVSKADLYWNRIDEARDYYLPRPGGRQSPFGELLRDLEVDTSLNLAVLPMGSRLIRHQFLPGLPAQTSQLDDSQLGVLRGHFSRTLRDFIDTGGDERR